MNRCKIRSQRVFQTAAGILCALLLLFLIPVNAEADNAEYIFDTYGLLNAEETEELESSLEELQNSYGIIGFVMIVDDATVGGSTDDDLINYIENFSDVNYFDRGGSIGLILNMESRLYYMDITGNYPLNVYTDARQKQIEDAFFDKLAEGDYSGALQTFADEAIRIAAWAADKDDVDSYRDYESGFYGGEEKGITVGRIFMSAVIAAIVAAVILVSLLQKHKEKKIARNANAYLVSGNMHMTHEKDQLVSTYVTKVPRANQQNSGGGGRTTTHRSSGGHSHSGRGGRF